MTDSSFNEVEVQNRIRERWTYFGYLLAIYGFLATTYLGLIIGIALDWNQRISTGMIYLFTSFTFLYINVLFTLIFGLISMLKKNFQLLFWFAYNYGYIYGIIGLVITLINLFFVVVVFFDEKSSNVANGLSLLFFVYLGTVILGCALGGLAFYLGSDIRLLKQKTGTDYKTRHFGGMFFGGGKLGRSGFSPYGSAYDAKYPKQNYNKDSDTF